MAEKDNTLITNADGLYFEENENEEGMTLNLEEDLQNKLAGLITDRFKDAERSRKQDEGRWMTAYHNYRGLYPKNVRFRESEKSRVFVKVTKTKVLAAFGQISDILFANNKFPITVSNTPIPEGIAEFAHLETPADTLISPHGFKGDGILLSNSNLSLIKSHKNNINKQGIATYNASTLIFLIVYPKFLNTPYIFFSASKPKNELI